MGVCVSVSTGNRAVAGQPAAPPGESREEGEEGTPGSSSVQSLPAATPGMQIWGSGREDPVACSRPVHPSLELLLGLGHLGDHVLAPREVGNPH